MLLWPDVWSVQLDRSCLAWSPPGGHQQREQQPGGHGQLHQAVRGGLQRQLLLQACPVQPQQTIRQLSQSQSILILPSTPAYTNESKQTTTTSLQQPRIRG